MSASVFIARLLGPMLLAMGIGLLLNRRIYYPMAEEFLRSPAMVYLAGLLTLPLGLTLVNVHNVWVLGWPVIITIFGWLSVIGGAVRLMFPQHAQTIGSRMLEWKMWWMGGGAVNIALGAILTYFGYWS